MAAACQVGALSSMTDVRCRRTVTAHAGDEFESVGSAATSVSKRRSPIWSHRRPSSVARPKKLAEGRRRATVRGVNQKRESPNRCTCSGTSAIWRNGDEDERLLGVYSSERAANERIEQARKLPGFQNARDGFHVDAYEVDRDEWPEGFKHRDGFGRASSSISGLALAPWRKGRLSRPSSMIKMQTTARSARTALHGAGGYLPIILAVTGATVID
jgi:hypothetical protein